MPQASTYSTDEPPKSDDDKDTFLKRALDRYERAVTADQDNRLAYIDDLRFRAGIQWPVELQRAREADDRPVLTNNEMPQFVRQVTGDVRQNTPAIKVAGVDGGSDKALAEIYTGLIRNIEQQSKAKYVYATGADAAVGGGFGAWRVVTQYTDDDSFEQDIRIKAIPNALSVIWDPLSIEIDKSDATYCFVHYRLPKSEFQEQYPGAICVDFEIRSDDVDGQTRRSWFDGEGVRVAEYWCKEPVTKKICKLQSGEVIDCTGMKPEDLLQWGPMMDLDKPMVREVKSHKIVQYIISGREVLDGPNEWAGKHIPIVHVPGEEVWVGENRVTHGIIRFLKDPQRLKNYMRSCSAEVVGQQPKMPWILTPGMIAGFEQDWQNAGKSGKPYLLWNPDPEFPGLAPQRSQPPVPAVGLSEEAALASEDMYRVSGIYPTSLGQKSNESSGIAIKRREQQGDTGTFVYIDNLSMAIARTGEILVDLIPRIYDTDRVVRVVGEDGAHNLVPINREMVVRGQNGAQKVIKFDLSSGKYDVTVATGPNFLTRKQEAAEGVLGFVQAVPDAGPLLGDILADLQDWPFAEKVKERMTLLLPPAAQPPKMGPDGQPLPPPEPPPDPKLVEIQQKGEIARAEIQQRSEQANAQMQLDMAQADHEAELEEKKAVAAHTLEKQKAEWKAELDVWVAQQTLALKRHETASRVQLAERQQVSNQRISEAKAARGMADEEGAAPAPEFNDTSNSDHMAAMARAVTAAIMAPTVIARDANGEIVGAKKVVDGAA